MTKRYLFCYKEIEQGKALNNNQQGKGQYGMPIDIFNVDVESMPAEFELAIDMEIASISFRQVEDTCENWAGRQPVDEEVVNV